MAQHVEPLRAFAHLTADRPASPDRERGGSFGDGADSCDSAHEGQGGGAPASALDGYGSERPARESYRLRLVEMRRGLSQSLMNLITFGWEEHGESQAALRSFDTHEDAGSRSLSKFPSPFQAKPAPCTRAGRPTPCPSLPP